MDGLTIRALARVSSSALVLLAMVVVGSVVLWAGVPLLWLWIASQLHYLSGSLGAALAGSLAGAVLTIALVLRVLGWLDRTHEHLREARGLPSRGPVMLEAIVVVSAFLAVIAFLVWFFAFTSGGPYPAYDSISPSP